MINQLSNGDALVLLQQWYAAQCNGDWEHTYGVKIDTLDNPGWILTVDLEETDLAGILIERNREVRSESDWVQYEVVGNKFVACGGPHNLGELIRCFLMVVSTR
jgi:hypothetical protein